MPDGTSLVNLGELSRPATVLVEKIADAIGGLARPWQTRRVAEAEAEAERIRAVTQIEITDLQRRALERFIAEEAKRQDNIESIVAGALPQLEEDAQPQDVEDDWITNFFDKCRLISDEEMRVLWSRVLAGEANSPGTYSKRTVNFLGSLDKSDAVLFRSLCDFGWRIEEDLLPLVYDFQGRVYNEHGIYFDSLKHLDEIGLLSLDPLVSYGRYHLPGRITVLYYGTAVDVEFKSESDNHLDVGHVLLSKVGAELAPICGSQAIPEFFDYILERWTARMGLHIHRQ